MTKKTSTLFFLLLFFTCAPDPAGSESSMPHVQFHETTSIQNIEKHLRILTVDIGERSVFNWENHSRARDYIQETFEALKLEPFLETYDYRGNAVSNVVAEIKRGPNPSRLFIVGAHYDTVHGTPGADDNGSGVSVLLELASNLQKNLALLPEDLVVRLVAFALEEPPVFSTPYMGSRVHAKAARERNEKIEGMICLEMVGYTCHQEGCQPYPFPLNFMNYPKVGDFIGIVGNFSSRRFTASLLSAFEKNENLPAISLSVPFNGWVLPAVRLSDHSSFWDKGFKAVMITDTAFFRNPHYHLPTDTMDKLDMPFMAELVRSLLYFFVTSKP